MKFTGSVSKIALVFCASALLKAAPQQSAPASPSEYRALLDKYCVTCHNDRLKTAGLLLDKADVSHVSEGAEVWEKVIRRLRAGTMPPQGLPKPEKNAVDGFTSYLETTLDTAAIAKPNPGRSVAHRLNRSEYANAVRDLLSLNIDPAQYLPSDDESYGFDNIADVLKLSPVLLERYMSAAWNISRLAVGDPNIQASMATYRVRPDLSQGGHIPGLPMGTRGGISVKHTFPLDGDYTLRIRLWRTTQDQIRGLAEPNQIEVTVDGARVVLATIGGKADYEAMVRSSGESQADIDRRLTFTIPVKAGERTVNVAFLKRADALDDHAYEPFERTTIDPVTWFGDPHVDRISLTGPFNVRGQGETPSRRKVFVCHPAKGADDVPCAKRILANLVKQAYRRPATDTDIEGLLSFYQKGKNKGGFEGGIEMALRAVLSDPEFIFRYEADPVNIAVNTAYKLNDLELASRLSFFLWSSIPDEQLLTVAQQGKLKDPVVLDQQVRRMLADKKSQAFIDNFSGQWLYLRNLRSIVPDPQEFPDFDDNLRAAYERETELFFESIVREDRSMIDLLTANYTFVNERLARHYGIRGVSGDNMQRVTLTDENRFGLLGKGSTLIVTSLATRTSPVQRGKWILSNVLGTPPPAPPPNVPPLKENADGGKKLSVRERMEAHRANPACAACHKIMDPIGFSLENFDAVGTWRSKGEDGGKIDASGQLADGTPVNGPASLRKAIAAKPDQFVATVTEKLMTYALGRGVDYNDMPAIRGILRNAAKENFKFSSVILGIVKSTPFQMRMKRPQDQEGQSVADNAAPRNVVASATR
jgi:mono/diheme cytochrome c family protein